MPVSHSGFEGVARVLMDAGALVRAIPMSERHVDHQGVALDAPHEALAEHFLSGEFVRRERAPGFHITSHPGVVFRQTRAAPREI